jgi:hypothetical protein
VGDVEPFRIENTVPPADVRRRENEKGVRLERHWMKSLRKRQSRRKTNSRFREDAVESDEKMRMMEDVIRAVVAVVAGWSNMDKIDSRVVHRRIGHEVMAEIAEVEGA